MSTYDWLLFLHLLGATAVVAALVVYGAVAVTASRSGQASDVAALLRLVAPSGMLYDVGGALLIAFGIWLALERDYGITDQWILAALGLWLVTAFTGTRTRVRFLAARRQAIELARNDGVASGELGSLVRADGALAFYGVSVAGVLAMLLLMVFKPGAG